MEDKKSKLKGLIATILIHGILFTFLFIYTFAAPKPQFPEPNGIEVALGELVIGDDVAGEPLSQIEQVDQQVIDNPNVIDDKIVTQSSSDVSIKQKEPVKNTPQLTPEEIEKNRKEEEFKKRMQSLANKSLNGKVGNGGTSTGKFGNSTTGNSTGTPGNKNGTPGVKNTKGEVGDPFGNKDAIYLAKPLNTVNCNFKIVITLKVNEQGNVISIVDYDTPLGEQSCIDAALKQAKLCRFKSDASREVRFARITYDYSISQR